MLTTKGLTEFYLEYIPVAELDKSIFCEYFGLFLAQEPLSIRQLSRKYKLHRLKVRASLWKSLALFVQLDYSRLYEPFLRYCNMILKCKGYRYKLSRTEIDLLIKVEVPEFMEEPQMPMEEPTYYPLEFKSRGIVVEAPTRHATVDGKPYHWVHPRLRHLQKPT